MCDRLVPPIASQQSVPSCFCTLACPLRGFPPSFPVTIFSSKSLCVASHRVVGLGCLLPGFPSFLRSRIVWSEATPLKGRRVRSARPVCLPRGAPSLSVAAHDVIGGDVASKGHAAAERAARARALRGGRSRAPAGLTLAARWGFCLSIVINDNHYRQSPRLRSVVGGHSSTAS